MVSEFLSIDYLALCVHQEKGINYIKTTFNRTKSRYFTVTLLV